MGKIAKVTLITISSIVGLIIVAAIAIPLFVDLNDYKPEIEAAVKDKTGRELKLVGDIDVSVFPWLGVSTGKITLSNAQGFMPDYFAVIKESDIKIKLMPLLSKEVEVSTIIFKGLELNLAKNKKGVSNWDDLAGKNQPKKAEEKVVKVEEKTEAAPALAALMIGGLSIEDAQIHWDDQQAGQQVIIKDFNLKTGKIALNEAIDIKLSLFVDNKKPALTEALALTTELVIDDSMQLIQLKNTKINSATKGAMVPNGAFDIQLLSQIAIDLKQESVVLESLKIAFDATTIDGFLRIKQFSKPALAFNLAINEIDVDRYTAADKAQTKVVASPAAAVAATTTLIPVKTIRDLNLNGDVSIGKLQAAGVTLGDITLNIQAKDGVLLTKQAIKQLYDGQYSGQLTLNAKSRTPKIALNEKVTNVQIGRLLKDFKPDQPAKLTGAINLAAKLNTRGNIVPQFKSNLAGNLSFSVNNGAIQGVNFQQMIDMGKMFNGKTMKDKYAKEQTIFSAIKGTGTVRRGVITNPDFLMKSAQLVVNGSGTVNLVNEALNYKVKATATNKATKDRPVGIKVAGTMSEPTYNVDVLSMINETEKKKMNKALDKALGEGGGKAVNKLLESFF